MKFAQFGYEIYLDEDNIWKWKDINIPISIKRPCNICKKFPLENDIDPCLGILTGVKGACCGHGVHNGYILFNNNTRIIFKKIQIIKE